MDEDMKRIKYLVDDLNELDERYIVEPSNRDMLVKWMGTSEAELFDLATKIGRLDIYNQVRKNWEWTLRRASEYDYNRY